jgi:tRNA(adenine34) deaminase
MPHGQTHADASAPDAPGAPGAPGAPDALGAPGTAEERGQGSVDHLNMGWALEQARQARARDEVPIGAVVVLDGEIVGLGSNATRGGTDPTAHAELLAISAAARAVGAQRLVGATVYSTVEPCFMCAGALLHARVARVVWGVRDEKFGACASLAQVLSDRRLNHQVAITEGVRADEARELLQQFFRSKRSRPQAAPATCATTDSAGSPSDARETERCQSG